MKKIEFDKLNGVYEVDTFGSETNVIDARWIFDYLKEDFEGTCGAEIDATTFDKIKEDYGIK
jgi:hypothetical protein